ncbi:hypothetical protein ARAM_006452 [Aspergillus rambellii]|uniref:F-box domain-containing protein n=1 Tax=Aspergillus rambellii TaxID=308745 RepID=A0A0F8UV32_9EURO|nr:hypothetical protein ARAM_006452 [Aspergillus rambellii]
MSLFLTLLPPEIHLLISTNLLFPDLLYLRLSCRYFYNLLPSPRHKDLLQAEQTTYAIAKNIYACRYCLRLRVASQFADRMLQRRRRRAGRDAWKRFCVECGLAPRSGEARYGPGAQIELNYPLKVETMPRLSDVLEHTWATGTFWVTLP